MDLCQPQYNFSVDEAVKKWRSLIANDGILLEKEFNVCFKFRIKSNEYCSFFVLGSSKDGYKSYNDCNKSN